MQFLTSILVLTLVFCIDRDLRMSQGMTFPDDINEWCPYSDFCGKKVRTNVSTTIDGNDRNVMPCCSSCSCTKDCGRKRNCCKDEYDMYRLDETLDTICKQLRSSDKVDHAPYYHVIDKCPHRSEICRSVNKKDNRYYFPVFSKESGMLYFNEKCALCHKQRNLARFTPIIKCKKLALSYFANRIDIMHSSSILDNCIVNFLQPDDIDLSTEVCYPFLIDHCIHSDNHLEEQPVLLVKPKLCHAFNATFHTQGRAKYSNVYCYLCQKNTRTSTSAFLNLYDFCSANVNKKTHFDVPFAMLLRSSQKFVEELEYTQSVNKSYPRWCGELGGKTSCRRVFCPEGQEFYRNRCRFRAKRWYFRYLRINIKLMPLNGSATAPTDVLKVYSESEKMFIQTKPGFEEYDVVLSYHVGLNNSFVSYFVAMLSMENINVDPKTFIHSSRDALKKTWVIDLEGNQLSLSPEFLKYTNYQYTSDDSVDEKNKTVTMNPARTHDTGTDGLDLNENVLHMVKAGRNADLKRDSQEAFFLTKLFFCELIELENHEFVDKAIRLELINQSIYLEEGEFTWSLSQDGVFKPRVCLNDMPGYNIHNSTSTHHCYLLWFYTVLIVIYQFF